VSVNKRGGVLFIYLFISKTVAVIREVENVGEVDWSGKKFKL